MNDELEKIMRDNISGSEELLMKIKSFLLREIENGHDIEKTLTKIDVNFSEFSAIKNFVARLRKSPAAERKSFIENYFKNKEKVYDILYDKLKFVFGAESRIVTISNSKTLTEIFLRAARDFPAIRIFVSESRPVFEGKIMADNLARAGLHVTLITEAMIPEYVKRCDFSLIGADKILPNGDAVNKIGSKIIALACKHYGKALYVVASSDKRSNENKFEQSPHPQNEICAETTNFEIAPNVYFETIEKTLITKIITD